MTRTWTIAPGLSRKLRAFVQNPTRTEAGETSLVQFAASGGVTYSIVVVGFNVASGRVSLALHSAAIPPSRLASVQVLVTLCKLEVIAETL